MSELRELIEDLAGGLRSGLRDTRPGRLRPWFRLLLAILAGAAAGLLVGLLVADLVGISGGLFGAMALGNAGGTVADFESDCGECLGTIVPGDRIIEREGVWGHFECPDDTSPRADRWDGADDEAMGY